ncbi:D-glycero-beta-D-manno-heptose 1,7-bisphosphate 7-phosphatase [Pseudoalteromonas sp. MMG013]|uniref:D-glycero-beta-D-manno-heptose 1,7-bisphosphate 7-phosphatase n=1 Tax=Pseudoalteromonas sp. MMG013 TaxID=2822687 RepID=UPI001B36B7C1|nr:D-glycero-beta-D-manno-heptose 1,7-bisphosphate 7-phosphatase [Pseudoalteromonas sp. MMG013]MBQ4864429.1 D-glycero-beta-D-manno-heptose 1,7-bisphosphate 7-phosphatase [Pseudoalteromonas sp. MMG013]
MSQKAIFLDRDGVINVDHAYVHKREDFQFIEGVFEACQYFIAQGYIIVVVTNQSGIGRGYYTEAQFNVLSQWMCEEFAKRDVAISKVYFCPHHPSKAEPEYLVDCQCRKPRAGMLMQAINEFDIKVENSVMVGDKVSDIQAARSAGVKTAILVESGQAFDKATMETADFVCSSLNKVPSILSSIS